MVDPQTVWHYVRGFLAKIRTPANKIGIVMLAILTLFWRRDVPGWMVGIFIAFVASLGLFLAHIEKMHSPRRRTGTRRKVKGEAKNIKGEEGFLRLMPAAAGRLQTIQSRRRR